MSILAFSPHLVVWHFVDLWLTTHESSGVAYSMLTEGSYGGIPYVRGAMVEPSCVRTYKSEITLECYT